MSNPKRRVVRVPIPCSAIDYFLKAGDERVYLDGLPPSSVLLATAFDAQGPYVNFFYSHESFPEVDEGAMPPILFPVYARGESTHWISAEFELPPTRKTVLAHYLNSFGKYRIVRSFYAAAFHMEADEECDEEFTDWVESESRAYIKQGWYEVSEARGEFYPMEETPTHWMNLPKPPSAPTVPVIEYR